MAKTYDNIRIYGDEESAVHVAPKGAPSPADLADPPADYAELGWLSEDGISVDREEDATSFKAYQGGKVVRRKTTSVEDSVKFQCLEETADSLGLYYKGQKFVKSADGNSAKLVVTDQTASDDRAFVIDVFDGDVQKRYNIASGAVGVGSVVHSSSDMTVYEFTVTIQGDYEVITNNPAVLEEAEPVDAG